jgi:hypothetical protein
METTLHLRIILEAPPPDVDFGLQEGKGADYKTVQTQRSKGGNLTFDCSVTVKDNRQDGLPNFLGPLTQGPPNDRFIYFDIGQFAGQKDSCWNRRLKIPLVGITWAMIRQASSDPKKCLEAFVPGTGKRGGPNCAKVKSREWKIVERSRRNSRITNRRSIMSETRICSPDREVAPSETALAGRYD